MALVHYSSGNFELYRNLPYTLANESSPLSEVPAIGRNLPYIITFGLFVILSVPLALIQNYAGMLVLRFLVGFMGSPCLATGGASMQDMVSRFLTTSSHGLLTRSIVLPRETALRIDILGVVSI